MFQISVTAGEIDADTGPRRRRTKQHGQAGHTTLPLFRQDETFAWAAPSPFGLNSRQMSAWMFENNGLQLMREFYAKYNMINFPGGNTGAQMGGWYRKGQDSCRPERPSSSA